MVSGAGKPNKAQEKAAGIVGATLAAGWVFDAAVHLLDWISRSQTIAALDPYVHYLVTPWALLTQFIAAVGLLFYATRLEHFREADEVPLIILAYTEPPKPKKHWLWLKVGIGSAAASLAVALSLGWWLHSRRPHRDDLNTTTADSGHANHPAESTNSPIPAKKPTNLPPDKTERQASLPKAAPAGAAHPGVPPPSTQPPQQTPQQGVIPIPPKPAQPDLSLPIACPPQGTLASGWNVQIDQQRARSGSQPIVFSYVYNWDVLSSLQPVLRNKLTPSAGEAEPLTAAQLREATGLTDEIRSKLPTPRSISTAEGPLPTQIVLGNLVRFFLKEPDSIKYGYATQTVGGDALSGESKEIQVSSLGASQRQAISDLDDLSKSQADTACKEALHNLAAKHQ